MTTRERLLRAAVSVLGISGAVGFSARAAEVAAGAPHGSVRNHFGSVDGLVAAMVDHLLAADLQSGLDLEAVLAHGYPVDRVRTAARYELMLMALRNPTLNATFLAARDRLIARAVELGVPEDRAPALLAGLDGLTFDALLRGRETVPLGQLGPLGATRPG